MAAGMAVYGAFAVTFSAFQVRGDGLFYFNLLRGFFGERTDVPPVAYQFGSDVWNAPFFLVGKLLGAIFGQQPQIFHVTFEEIAMTVAAQTAFFCTLYLGWRILSELELPAGPGVLLLTAFGSPLFYYVIFEPAAKHAVDTLVLTAATFLLVRSETHWTSRRAVAIGALGGLAATIRYVDVAFFLPLAVALWRSAPVRRVALALSTAVVVGAGIFVLPALRGVRYEKIPNFLRLSAEQTRLAVGHRLLASDFSHPNPIDNFDATIPLKMLSGEHRGLFLWTPLTAMAVAGFVIALSTHGLRGVHRRAYVTLAVSSLGLLLVHSIWNAWDGGFAFSQRFLTGLYPLYIIGVAELVRRMRTPVACASLFAALAAAVAFAVAVALIHNLGYDNVSERDGVGRVVEVGIKTQGNLRHKVWRRATKRWHYLWGLSRGEDPERVNGP